MITWLSDKQRTRPELVDASVAVKPGYARVEPDFLAGTVVLKGESGEFQLAWTRQDKRRVRGVPPGKYTIRTVRIERERDGTVWMISQAGPSGRVVDLEADKVLRLEFEEVLVFRFIKRHRRPGRLQLAFTLTGTDGRGISVYRDSKRVPLVYKLRTESRRILERGRMTYGTGGGGSASIRRTPRNKDTIEVKYELATGPFGFRGAKIQKVAKSLREKLDGIPPIRDSGPLGAPQGG